MLQLQNETPFQAALALFPNPDGIDALYTTVKATCLIGDSISPASEQLPLCPADEYYGEPGASSVARPGDVHLTKPGTDVLLIGQAWSPTGRPITELDVVVRAGDLQKSVRVTGDRHWQKGMFSGGVSDPEPFVSMPLTWERAYGGVHVVDAEKNKILFEARNPVGCGFTGKRSMKELDGEALPNVEDPEHLIRKPGQKAIPACFAPIAPAWEPRKSYAGTYDEDWQRSRMPYLPTDFDNRFFNLAPEGLTAAGYLAGDEAVEVVGASPAGPLRFRLPGWKLEANARLDQREHELELHLETVLIEPDEKRLTLLWRAELECDKAALAVEQVRVALSSG